MSDNRPRLLNFRLLGPVEVAANGESLPLGGPKQRAFLALLLLRANEVVSRERLIDELWGEEPPPRARETLKVYASRLRKLLAQNGAGGELVFRGNGYALLIDPRDLDLHRFERLAEEGRRALQADEAGRAAQLLREALALWRGQPLADFGSEPFAARERTRLDELRTDALEDRLDADLALGRHADLVSELERLLAEHPYRERLWAHLMLALYHGGRQADALEAYRRARRVLTTELGIEPGPGLRELERQILAQDPKLAPPVPASARLAAARVRRGRASAAVAAAIAAVVGVVALIVGAQDSKRRTFTTLGPNAVGLIDPETNRIVARFAIGQPAQAVAAGEGYVWVPKEFQQTVRRIDQDTGSSVEIGIGHSPRDVAVGFGRVWVVAMDSLTAVPAATLIALEPATATVGRTWDLRGKWKPFGDGPARATVPNVAVGAGSVWVSSSSMVWRIDPRTFRVVAAVRLPDFAYSLAVDEGAAWVTGANFALLRIDAHTNAVATIDREQSSSAWGLSVSDGAVWISDYSRDSLRRVDPLNGETTGFITVGDFPGDVVAGGGSIWVAAANSVARVDPRANRVVATIAVGHHVEAIAWGENGLWVLVARQS